MRIVCLSIFLLLSGQFASASSPICDAPRIEEKFRAPETRLLLHKEELLTLPRRPDVKNVHERHELPIEVTPSFVY